MASSIIFLFLASHSFVVSIEPARPLAVNDTFRIKVNAGDWAQAYAYDIMVKFDSMVLEALEVKKGSFLGRFGSTIVGAQSFGPGIARFAEALMGSSKSARGNGTLFAVKFKVLNTGSSQIEIPLDSIQIASPDGKRLPFLTVLNGWYGSQSMGKRGTFAISQGGDVQEVPSAAWIPTVSRYAVAWQDRRSGNYNIYGQQVNPNQTLYGVNYITCDSIGDQLEPAIAYNPVDFLGSRFAFVVWTDYRKGLDSADIYGRLLLNGAPASSEYKLVTYPGFQNNPQIACCGSRYLLVWQDLTLQDTSTIFGQLRARTGMAIGDTFRISGTLPSGTVYIPPHRLNPAITSGDSAFLVTWTQLDAISGLFENALKARIVDTLGQLGTIRELTEGYYPSKQQWFLPACAFDGTNYLVVWSRWQDGVTSFLKKVEGRFVAQDGSLIGNMFTIYETADPFKFVQTPKVDFDGNKYLVVWDEETRSSGIDTIKASFVSTSGLVYAPIAICTSPYQQAFPANTMGTSSFVFWQDYRSGSDFDIWGYLGPPIAVEESVSQKQKTENQSIIIFPNPARGKVHISYSENNNTKDVELKIYDATGRPVKSFKHSTIQPVNQVIWSGEDDSGMPVESGVYFVKVGTQSEKFLLLK